jgi:hypothetical protein
VYITYFSCPFVEAECVVSICGGYVYIMYLSCHLVGAACVVSICGCCVYISVPIISIFEGYVYIMYLSCPFVEAACVAVNLLSLTAVTLAPFSNSSFTQSTVRIKE